MSNANYIDSAEFMQGGEGKLHPDPKKGTIDFFIAGCHFPTFFHLSAADGDNYYLNPPIHCMAGGDRQTFTVTYCIDS